MMTQSSVKHRFQDKEYHNWIKLSQALVFVAQGLRPFCERVIRECHELLREKIGDKKCHAKCKVKKRKKKKSISNGATCNVDSTAEESDVGTNEATAEGTADDHEEHDTDTKASWYIECPNDICNKWFDVINAELCGEPYSWKNTNVKMWPTQSWQLAKIFLGPGQQPSTPPSKTDALGLLQLIKNCKLFHDRVDRGAAGKVMFCFY